MVPEARKMDANLFKENLIRNYPSLKTESVNELVTLLDIIPRIAEFGEITADISNKWLVLSPNQDSIPQPTKNIICRAAGQSRYNPMKWETAFTLKHGLKKLLKSYEEHQHIASLGILITDIWRPVELYEYAREIERYEKTGVSTVAVLFSGKSVTPISWPWR